MSIQELDRQIQSLDATIVGKRAAMAELSERIIASLKPFLQEWLGRFVAQRVREVPETAKSMTPERLSEMKAKVEQLRSKLPTRLDEEFARAKTWPHENDLPYIRGSQPIMPYIADPVNRALADINPIFREYGFIAAMHYIGGQIIPWPEESVQLARAYSRHVAELEKRLTQRRTYTIERERAQAEDLWNKA
jgi:hypothetical protein